MTVRELIRILSQDEQYPPDSEVVFVGYEQDCIEVETVGLSDHGALGWRVVLRG